MNQLKSFQDKLFRQYVTGKYSQLFSPTVLATLRPIIYRDIEKAYKKGMKRGKNEIIEVINKIKL